LYLSYEARLTPVGCVSNFLYIVMGFAVINVIFAWFLQNQVWKEIMRHSDEFIDGDAPEKGYTDALPSAAMGALGGGLAAVAQATGKTVPLTGPKEPAPPKAAGKIIVPKNVTQQAFKKVFMEDFVVLFMFVALIGMFVLSWKGQAWVDTQQPVCKVGNAEYCGYAYFGIPVMFCFAYYCCACCSASVTMKKPESEDGFVE